MKLLNDIVRRAAIVVALSFATMATAQEPVQDNAEMAAMFAADQSQRAADIENYEAAAQADADRRLRTRALYHDGKLRTGADFFGAAFIFQHGTEPSHYLFAHVLAMRSLALGRKDAEWIAAATLDRYLQSLGQGQVYGTQYRFPSEGGVTMDPYDRVLLSDAQRRASGAGDLASQERKLAEYAALVAAPVESKAD